MVGKIVDIRFRKWLYRVGTAVGAILVMYGIINSEELVVWLALLLAVLGITADANVGLAGVTPRHAVDSDNENE